MRLKQTAFQLLLCLALVLAVFSATPALAKETTLTIVATSDMHGHVMPIDYFTGKTDDGGLAQIATIVKRLSAGSPNFLLIDDGDTIEGGNSTLPYHYQFDPKAKNPMAVAMNLLPYASMTVGNHEFNYGLDVLNKFKGELNFPLISANVVGPDGKPYFTPYVIKNVGGIRVAILGLTTSKVPTWEKPQNIAGLKFLDPVEVAKSYIPELRKKADVIIIAAHTGPEKAPKDQKDLTNWTKPEAYVDQKQDDENFAFRLAAVPGVDLVVAGHSHLLIPGIANVKGINEGAMVVEPSSWGQYVARVNITLNKPLLGSWKVTKTTSEMIPVDKTVENDKDVVAAIQPYHDQTNKYYTSPVGQCLADVPGGLQARFTDTALIAVINRAQLWATGADISAAALFTEASELKKGGISIRDIYGLYIYPNTLYTIKITGKQLRDALEQDATYFKQFDGTAKTYADAVDPRARGYNWDIYMGIQYTIDLSKPVGQRVVELKFKGRDVLPEDTFILAVNNYRAGGGGGYPMFTGTPVLSQSDKEVREIIVDYIKQLPNQTIDPATLVNGDFTLLPAEGISQLK